MVTDGHAGFEARWCLPLSADACGPSERVEPRGADVFSGARIPHPPSFESVERPCVWRFAWRYLWLASLVLFGDLGLTAPATAAELARAKRVYDGDTILLEDGRRVRYLGINAPEFQEPFYLKAKRFNESLVLGRQIRLEYDEEKTDGYDRLLAYVYVREEMVNTRLVEEGLAHAFFVGPSRKHNALLLRLQGKARQRRVGIWSARARVRDLKITSIHPLDPAKPDPYATHVRIANLSDGLIRLAGYVLSNEEGHRFVFPDVSVASGYTVIVASADGTDGVDERGQLVVHWPTQGSVWDPKEDTAFLLDPTGALVDMFHYKGKRVTRSPQRSRGKTP